VRKRKRGSEGLEKAAKEAHLGLRCKLLEKLSWRGSKRA
jgi:hypothetical protein